MSGGPKMEATSLDFSVDARYEEVRRILPLPQYTNCGMVRSASGSTCSSSPSDDSACSLYPLSSKKASDRYASCLIVVAILLAAFCLVLAACVGILFYQLEQVRSQLTMESVDISNDRKICLLCDELTMSPFEEENDAFKLLDVTYDKHGDQVCCANNANQAKDMFDLLFEKKNKIQCMEEANTAQKSCNVTSTGPFLSGRATAHLLVGTQNTGLRNDYQAEPIRNWRTDSMTSHIEGIHLQNDRIVINQTGLYVIYSQIYFSKYNPPGVPRSTCDVFHYVYRYNVIYYGGNQLLMKSVKTLSLDPVTSHTDHTSYTSATLRLNVGDQIYVKVSNISMVSRAEKASFLGVVQIA